MQLSKEIKIVIRDKETMEKIGSQRTFEWWNDIVRISGFPQCGCQLVWPAGRRFGVQVLKSIAVVSVKVNDLISRND